MLGKVKRFAQVDGVHVWFVAHPSKRYRDNGKLPVPGLYDISGSANWVNKVDLGIVVHRDFEGDPTRTEIHVRKVRFKQTGKIGVVSLRYDKLPGGIPRSRPRHRPPQQGTTPMIDRSPKDRRTA